MTQWKSWFYSRAPKYCCKVEPWRKVIWGHRLVRALEWYPGRKRKTASSTIAWYRIRCELLSVSHCQCINNSCRCPCSFNFHLVGKPAVIVIWRSSHPVIGILFQATRNTKVIYRKLLFLWVALIGMTQFKQWRRVKPNNVQTHCA